MDRYRAQRGDLMHIPSPFWGNLNGIHKSLGRLPEVLKFANPKRDLDSYGGDVDRRLPMINTIGADEPRFHSVQSRLPLHQNENIDGWEHIQYLGEHLVRGNPVYLLWRLTGTRSRSFSRHT